MVTSAPACAVRPLAAGPAPTRAAHLLTCVLSIHCRLQKCPFEAIMIINLPKDLEKETTHRYGPNAFKLHRRARVYCAMLT